MGSSRYAMNLPRSLVVLALVSMLGCSAHPRAHPPPRSPPVVAHTDASFDAAPDDATPSSAPNDEALRARCSDELSAAPSLGRAALRFPPEGQGACNFCDWIAIFGFAQRKPVVKHWLYKKVS